MKKIRPVSKLSLLSSKMCKQCPYPYCPYCLLKCVNSEHQKTRLVWYSDYEKLALSWMVWFTSQSENWAYFSSFQKVYSYYPFDNQSAFWIVLNWTIYAKDKFSLILKWSRLVEPLKSPTGNWMAIAIA